MSCHHVRFIILALCVTAACFASITRYNLNIAIVDMTNHPASFRTTNTSSSHDQEDDLSPTALPEEDVYRLLAHYNWDQQLQGTILGSFFWTYMIFQVPAGVCAEWFGSRWLLTISLFGSGIINIITPHITGCTVAFIASRLALGLCQAGCFPGSFALLVKWMPLYERSFAFSLLRVGAIFGSVLIALVSGLLCTHQGWPSVFYLSGVLSMVAGCVIVAFMKEYPEDHSWMTVEELSVIKSDAETEKDERINHPIPWCSIFTSPAILSYGLFKFAMFWVFFTLSAKLPTYLNDEKGMDIGSNGVTNSLFNLSYGISLCITGYLSDRVIERKLLSRTATRKSFSIVTGFGSASCLIFVPFVHSPPLMHFLLYFGALCLGFSSGGDVPLPSEMSKNFPATIFALINMISMISGCTSPSFAGLVLTSFPPAVAWPVIFVSASLVMGLSTIIFLIFVSAERLKFEVDAEKRRLMHDMKKPVDSVRQ